VSQHQLAPLVAGTPRTRTYMTILFSLTSAALSTRGAALAV
jgi:hypothetical protein